MPTFISMLSWTDQGIRSVKEAPEAYPSRPRARQENWSRRQAGVSDLGKI